jgi:alkylation response protein AidB-like acyl-CoA dehydrogenase
VEFALSDDQTALQSAVRDLIAGAAGLDVVRSVVDDPDGDGDPPGLWARIAEQGWPAILVPEEHDGLGLGLLDAAVVVRCLGAGVVPSPLLPTLLGVEALVRAGSPEQRKAWLPRVAAGDVRLSVALPGSASGTGVTVTASATPGDAGGTEGSDGTDGTDGTDTLTGSALHVDYAHLAERIVVAATAGDALAGAAGGAGLWLVDPAGPGVTVTRTPVLDGTARPATVVLDHAPAERLAGGDGATVADLVDRGAVLTANDLVGIAREALTRTLDYVRTREQFGRPVGSFQALKHHLADLAVEITMAEHAAWYAAHAVDAALPDAPLAVSVAKAAASDAAREATAKMIQYHGGIGYTWEHEAHLFFKRAKREEYAYGDATTHRERIATLVVDAPAP